jgi:dynactin-4
LYPQHKNLSIKRSIRCRHCEHNVIKPEYNPTSIKYRIQQFASSHIPEVRVIKCDALVAGQNAFITLKITNPTMNDMTITIMELPTEEMERMMIEEVKKAFENVSISSKSSLMRPSLIEDQRMVSCKTNANLELPDSSFVINQRDDSSEFDDDIQSDKKDPKFIIWRKANKVAIQLNIQPEADLKLGDEVKIGFTMNFTYSSVPSSTPEKKDFQQQRHALSARIYINAGKIN